MRRQTMPFLPRASVGSGRWRLPLRPAGRTAGALPRCVTASKAEPDASATPGHTLILPVHVTRRLAAVQIAASANDNKGQQRGVNRIVENCVEPRLELDQGGSRLKVLDRPDRGVGGSAPSGDTKATSDFAAV